MLNEFGKSKREQHGEASAPKKEIIPAVLKQGLTVCSSVFTHNWLHTHQKVDVRLERKGKNAVKLQIS